MVTYNEAYLLYVYHNNYEHWLVTAGGAIQLIAFDQILRICNWFIRSFQLIQLFLWELIVNNVQSSLSNILSFTWIEKK